MVTNRAERRKQQKQNKIGSDSEPNVKTTIDKLPLDQRKNLIAQNCNKMKMESAGTIGQILSALNKSYDSTVDMFMREMMAEEDKINQLQKEKKALEDLLAKNKIKTA